MDKKTIFATSSYSKKYFFDEITESLPIDIKNSIKEIGVYFVNKVGGIFSIGFYDDNSLFIDYSFSEDDFLCDEIGAKLEIEKIKREEKELISSLTLWYKVFNKK
ncbi:DUF6145 family protein [uncultured Tyzzerella sp.]|uniref:DUF6145 family protein n=1 Tax=uncultured Tyzzerella sp. TaxID=2321398 RepID=UPI002943F6AF|nr:DUF6145 family protein [uncultured Tyzzerella sp.]